MKNKLLIAFIFIFVRYQVLANNLTDNRNLKLASSSTSLSFQDTTLTYLLSLNLDYYKNKPVDTLLASLPSNYTNRIIHGMGNLKVAKVLSVRYTGNIRVLIFVKDFTHLNPRSETLQWDINLFKEENIDCIEIWKDNVLASSGRCLQH